jgi:hypothetical protein
MSLSSVDSNEIMDLDDLNEREEDEGFNQDYVTNSDVQKSFDYIKNLPEYSRDLISYYNSSPSFNSIYKKDNQNTSCDDIKLLQKIFDESPPLQNELKVYRGLSIDKSSPVRFELDQLISTSTTYKIAEEFLKDDILDRKFILDIKLKPGVKFLAISLPGTMFSSEHEILLPPGGLFDVVSEDQTNMIVWNDLYVKHFRVPILKINIDYYPRPYEIDCIQKVLDHKEQYQFILLELSKRSSISELKKNILESETSRIKHELKKFIDILHHSYRYILIDLMIKTNLFEKIIVYKVYLDAISIIEKKIMSFLEKNNLSKHIKHLSKEIIKLKNLVNIDKNTNGKLFRFDPSNY